MTSHKRFFKSQRKGKSSKINSFVLFDKYGIENCKITLIESVAGTCFDDLKTREAHYIRALKCVNRVMPIRRREEIYEYQKQYNQSHKEKIKNYNKKYREENHDAMNKQKRQY